MAAVAGGGAAESAALVVSEVQIVQAVPIDWEADTGAAVHQMDVEQTDRRLLFSSPCHKCYTRHLWLFRYSGGSGGAGSCAKPGMGSIIPYDRNDKRRVYAAGASIGDSIVPSGWDSFAGEDGLKRKSSRA
eukprot:6172802-Pleurochrysis_carterae.AAC.1